MRKGEAGPRLPLPLLSLHLFLLLLMYYNLLSFTEAEG